MTAARQRMTKGETRYCKPSRFLEEIPKEFLEEERLEPALSGFGGAGLPWNQQEAGSSYTGRAGSGCGGNGFSGGRDLSGSGVFDRGRSAYASGTSSYTSVKPSFGKTFTIRKADSLDYKEGDRVSHLKFGEGTVKNIKDGGKDYEVTVEFDRVGQKRMFASFAKLKKI